MTEGNVLQIEECGLRIISSLPRINMLNGQISNTLNSAIALKALIKIELLKQIEQNHLP